MSIIFSDKKILVLKKRATSLPTFAGARLPVFYFILLKSIPVFDLVISAVEGTAGRDDVVERKLYDFNIYFFISFHLSKPP